MAIRSKKRKVIYSLLAIAISLSCVLIVSEVAIRLFIPSHRWEFRDATSDWQLDSVLGWVNKSNLSVRSIMPENAPNERVFWFKTNADGLMPATAQRERKTGVLRIMIFGDSTVVGRAVPQEQTVNAYLENYLNTHDLQSEVICAGVQGYSTDQSLLRMMALVPLYTPDIVIHATCTNDFGGNVSEKMHGLYKPKFEYGDEGLLEVLAPKENKGIKMSGSGISHWVQHSALYRMLQPKIIIIRAKLGSWEDRNMLGLGAIYYRAESFKKIDWKIYRYLIQQMSNVSNENGAKFLLYAHPAVEEVWQPHISDIITEVGLSADQYDQYAIENRIIRITDELNIDFMPSIEEFLQHGNEGPFHLLPRNPHCNAKGYGLTAKLLGEKLLAYRGK